MNLGEWLEKWNMTSLKIKTPFLDMEFKPQNEDKNAAWELYIELLTRITTQPLGESHGDEKAALNSIYSIFPLTREVIKSNGSGCVEFTKIAIVILNQVIRPFTTKWHRMSIKGEFLNTQSCQEFREELTKLQSILNTYIKMLGDMAGVEDDLSKLQDNETS